MVSKRLNCEDFCNLHYSNNEKRDKFSKDLILYWAKAAEQYNKSFSDLTTEPKTKLSALESFKIMVDYFGVEDTMLIINFTSRNRPDISRLIGQSHNLIHPEGSYKLLRPCLNEWFQQIDDPYTRDSLQDLINSYYFRSKITQKLHGVETKDICATYLIVAKIQQVRRIRVGFSKNPEVLELIDKILDAAWFKFDNLKSKNGFKAIRNNSATKTEHLDMLILMQYHLTNNRRLIPSGNNWETDYKNIFSYIEKMEELCREDDSEWAKAYYWWSLWVLRKNKKIRLQPVREIEEKITDFRMTLNPDLNKYFENMEMKERKNLESSEKKSGYILNCLDVLLEHQNNPSNRIKTDKKEEKRLIIKSFLSTTIGSEAKNLTNFYCKTTTMKVVRLDFNRSSPKDSGFRESIVRNETSSIIESVLKEIRFAKSALNIQESKNNYTGIINISVIIAQLFMKINSFLSDSRITKKNWKENYQNTTFRSSIWTEDRSELENELSKEILGEMKIFLSEVDNFLLRAELSTDIALENPKSNDDAFRSLIFKWILDIEELGKNNKIKLHLVGEMFGDFTGLNKPKSQSLFLYSRKNKIKLELSKSKLNLAPVGESLSNQ